MSSLVEDYPYTAAVLEGRERWALVDEDCLEFLPKIPDCSIDAIVTDPPAGISFMGRTWDKPGVLGVSGGLAMPTTTSTRNPSCRTCGGRKRAGPATKACTCGEPDWNDVEWRLKDRGAFVAFLVNVMRECYRMLKPGGHALVWALPRTSHWTATAIEDAGFEIRDVVTHHYGSGFPKSLDVAKAVARRAGGPIRAQEAVAFMRDRREELGLSRRDLEVRIFGRSDGNVRNWEEGISIPAPGLWTKIRSALELESTPFDADLERGDQACNIVTGSFGYQADGGRWNRDRVLREPVTDLTRHWQGWGTALKPASEHWILARKPIIGTVADNVLRYGTGALNIDGCRVATNAKLTRKLGKTTTSPSGWTSANRSPVAGKDGGRWPANIVLSHASGCELIGTRRVKGITGTAAGKMAGKSTDVYGKFNGSDRAGEQTGYVDADGMETVEQWRCVEGCPVAEIDRQSGASQSRVGKPRGSKEPGDGWGMTKTGAEYDDRGGASRFFFVAKPSRKEREAGLDGLALAPKNAVYGDGLNSATKIRTEEQAENGVDRGGVKNNHPTVKSVTLMRYLCRLITPPNGIVLDPFTGSGSTGCGALLEGFRFIGIEREPAYCQIAMARIAHWEQQANQQTEEL